MEFRHAPKRRRWAIGIVLVSSTLPLSAHHTISSAYDLTRHATLSGVVESVEWKLPHSFIHLTATSADGGSASWQIETEATYVIRRRAADLLDTLKTGDNVTVSVCLSKDGGPQGWLREITTSAGMTFNLSAGGC